MNINHFITKIESRSTYLRKINPTPCQKEGGIKAGIRQRREETYAGLRHQTLELQERLEVIGENDKVM